MYEHLLGIRQPPRSYGFERLELAPPLIDTLPRMAGRVQTVRGEVVLAWAWVGEPMHSTFVLNCTIPPNVLTTVVIPVPGIEPIVQESGTTVFAAGQFVHGVSGVTSGQRDAANDTRVILAVGSGSYRFSTVAGAAHGSADGSAKNSSLTTPSQSPLVISGCETRLQCPRRGGGKVTVARVLRAGLVPSEEVDSFSLATQLHKRYLVPSRRHI